MWRLPSSPQIHQKYIYMWNNPYRTPTECWQKNSDLPKHKKLPMYLGRAKEKRKNRDKRRGTGPAPVGGSWEGRKGFHTVVRPFVGGGGGKLRSHGGERSNRGAEGKAERFPHGGSMPASTHQPKRHVCLPAGGWGLGAEARASGVRPQGVDWGWLREHSLKGVSAPQLAGRESGKRSGAAEEARDFFLPLSLEVGEERGLRALLKGAPETGASCGYQCGPQRRAWDAKAATAATKKPVCKHRSLSTLPSREPVQPATARVPCSRDIFPGRTHSMPHACATSRWLLPPQARLAFRTLPSPWPG